MTSSTETDARLSAKLTFLLEADKLKTVQRANQLMDRSRFENSAEHSWHACLAAHIFAPLADVDVDQARVIEMLILHDLVEIDAGDHPIHIDHDPASVATLERTAADRIYGLLPDDLGARFRSTWEEFEAMETPTARFAKSIDYLTSALQSIGSPQDLAEESRIVAQNLAQGRATHTRTILPELFAFTKAAFEGAPTDQDLAERFRFWCEADRLKSIARATPIMDGSRKELSGEHSWHVMLWALTMAEHSHAAFDLPRALLMLLLHDLVEIDAGDTPIHGVVTDEAVAEMERAERAAADRIFGLLPAPMALEVRAIWDEFELAESATAIYAKSIDRAQPVLHNLATDGGSWRTYDVTLEQLETRVGVKVSRGTANVWPAIRARVTPWFAANR